MFNASESTSSHDKSDSRNTPKNMNSNSGQNSYLQLQECQIQLKQWGIKYETMRESLMAIVSEMQSR